jgi:hypothetical protein
VTDHSELALDFRHPLRWNTGSAVWGAPAGAKTAAPTPQRRARVLTRALADPGLPGKEYQGALAGNRLLNRCGQCAQLVFTLQEPHATHDPNAAPS